MSDLVREYLARARELCDAALDELLPGTDQPPGRLHESMRYSCLAPGKRLRPALAFAACRAFAGDEELCRRPAAALEMIHAYSLIHDDLPAMDDDDQRRGLPTCHKRFDEATAILAGDGLLTLAFEILATQGWHRKILWAARYVPRKIPCTLSASMAYWEQLGTCLQEVGSKGDMIY